MVHSRDMKTVFTLLWTIWTATGCYSTGAVEAETETNSDSTDSGSDAFLRDSESSETDTIDSDTDSDDTDTFGYEESLCDGLSDTECEDSDSECGLMYVHPVHTVDGSDDIWAACVEGTTYGCTSLRNCYETIEVALDPDGECWWMPQGCLPNELGWKPAIDDDFCKSPVRRHSCIQ